MRWVWVPVLSLTSTGLAAAKQMCESNSPLPSGPLLGNGDLGLSVGCNKARTEVTLYIGLNQVWLLNEYQHWSDNSGDQVGPRRLGVGGITISAPETAGGNFSAELDMAALDI